MEYNKRLMGVAEEFAKKMWCNDSDWDDLSDESKRDVSKPYLPLAAIAVKGMAEIVPESMKYANMFSVGHLRDESLPIITEHLITNGLIPEPQKEGE